MNKLIIRTFLNNQKVQAVSSNNYSEKYIINKLIIRTFLNNQKIQGVSGKFCDNTAKMAKKEQKMQISNIYSK